jgi:WD40 repeat protein
MEKLKVFISGTQDDMKPERDAVDRAVNSTTLATGIRAEATASQPKSPRAWIEQQIHECNIYIGVYSHRYGWVIPDENVSATEFEFNLARKLGKPILVWIRKLRNEEKTKTGFDRQEQFLNRVSDFSAGFLRQEFDNPADLEKWGTSALGETFTEIIRRGTAPIRAKFLVPFPHNPDFVGREMELSGLHEMMQQGHSIVGIRPTVLVGLGGIGKTQLAVEYAHAHRDDYLSGVFWLNAINPLLIEFADLAEKLEMADKDTPRDKAARKAWDYLDSHPDSLVIFDNVLEPSELNVPFSPDLVPVNLRCRTLFTTRQRDFPRTFQPFEVKVLPEMAAMHLLLRSRPEVLEEHHPEWGWARIVCAELGWLPLALELAAAYLGEYPEVSITGYLERLRTEGSLETVDESKVRAVNLPTRVEEILKAVAEGNLEIKHQVAVSATLQTQWKRLDDIDAQALFRAAGQFPEASWLPFPRLALLTGIEGKSKAGHPSPLSKALKKLHAVSLIEELSEDRMRLHPLVQEFAEQLSPTTLRQEMAERVAIEFNDLLRLQARAILYGVDIVLEDIRTALIFCIEHSETKTYSYISKIEHVLDKQMHALRNWNTTEQPAFFLQQIRNEAFSQGLKHWQVQAEAELARLKRPYLLERLPLRSNPAELRTLIGHSKHVTSLALSADGQVAISASSDRTLRVWDVTTGRELRILTENSDMFAKVVMSADGQLAISTLENALKVWDVTTGREIRTLAGHSNNMNSVAVDAGKRYKDNGVALSADGLFAISSSGNTLIVWDVVTGRELRTLVGHDRTVYGVALNADGRLAVSTSYDDGTIKVWDVTTGRELHTLTGHNGMVYSVTLSANGQMVVSASKDETIKLWDVETGRELRTLIGHIGRVNSIALSVDGRLVISASKDGTIKLWDVETGCELRTLIGDSGEVNKVVLSADGQLAISASFADTLIVWDIMVALNTTVANGSEQNMLVGESKSMDSVALSADGRLAVSLSKNGTIKVWDVIAKRELRTLTGYSCGMSGVALSANGRLAVASTKSALKVWDVATGRELCTLVGHIGTVSSIALSADGRLAVSTSYDGSLKVWDLETGHEPRTLMGRTNGAMSRVALSTDGRLAVSISSNCETLWDITVGRELYTFTSYGDTDGGLTLSGDGRLTISESWNKFIKERGFSLRCGSHTLIKLIYKANGAALGEDALLAASVSYDQTLEVWDITTGYRIAYLLVDSQLNCCAMSADGKIIIAGDSRGGLHFLELVGAEVEARSS